MANVTLGGNPIGVAGNLPAKGAAAPDFTLTSKDLKDVSLKDFAGKRKVLNIVPSLDTPVCAKSTRIFNERASSMPNTAVLVISADLPFAMNAHPPAIHNEHCIFINRITEPRTTRFNGMNQA